ncbi:MAG: CPBP family intramembrane glutamic endopeptidase [Cyclobacteriaceae bacterium]
MYENELGARPERHPVINLIVILLMVGLGFIIVGPTLGFFAALPFYEGGGMEELYGALQSRSQNPQIKIPFYIIQGFATFVGLIVAPAIFLRNERRSLGDLFSRRGVEWIPVVVTAIAVVIFMAVNSVFIEWNAELDFPGFASKFENWAREYEDSAAELTRFITTFDSAGELVFALIIIAILPAIGEEIVFRGLIQNELYRGTKNIHVSIWFAAFLFSAIHFQFFGFIPRLLLGALFGYLYYWSGNLMLAIVAHFVNNAVSVVALYLYQQGKFTFDVESQESAPANVVIMSALLTAGLLYYFYKYYQDRKIAIP